MADHSPLRFAAQTRPRKEEPTSSPWSVLVVDDEPEVHEITQLVLRNFHYNDRSLIFHSAFSASEAELVLDEYPDIAVILLDVVMETDTAGLSFVEHVRKVVCNQSVQIILRTGQPGHAPEERVVQGYQINSYTLKTDLTAARLRMAVDSALQNYEALVPLVATPSRTAARNNQLLQDIERLHQVSSRRTGQEVTGKAPAAEKAPEKSVTDGLQLCRVDLNDLVKAATEDVRLRQGLDQPLVVDLKPPTRLVGDRDKLHLVLVSLLENAACYTSDETLIRVCGRPIGEEYRLSVIDEGPGMAEELRDRVFNSLTSGPLPAVEVAQGLGLSLAKQRVEKHGGRIRLESALGHGTAVHLILPLVPPVEVRID